MAFRDLSALGYNEAEVKAIAASYTINAQDPLTGEFKDRPGMPSDKFPHVTYAGKGVPPDLSLITKARHGGAAYIHSLLTGYDGQINGTLHHNRYFPGGWIAMPPPLAEGAVPYADGTATTVEQYATDVSAFLQWAADPHMEERKRLGFVVLAFLIALAGLMYLAYKGVWRGESH